MTIVRQNLFRSVICLGVDKKYENLDPKIIAKFWENIVKETNQPNACWNWKGLLNGNCALPLMRRNAGNLSPRRISLAIHNINFDENDNIQPLVCKNKLCLNPAHLIAGNEARFWSKVQKLPGQDGCWIWTAGCNSKGYGNFSILDNGKRKYIIASRYSWYLAYGEEVPNEMCICHKCDNPPCVRPDHLFLGTREDNSKDCCQKGRQVKGENVNSAKLTELQVQEIRIQYVTSNASQLSLSKKYNISESVVQSIVNNKIWKHIIKDNYIKKRESKGENHGCAKLTESQIKKIRETYINGDSSETQLAKIYGVTIANISRIINRKLWKHVK